MQQFSILFYAFLFSLQMIILSHSIVICTRYIYYCFTLKDAMELDQLINYLINKENSDGVVLLGHSTGCQVWTRNPFILTEPWPLPESSE